MGLDNQGAMRAPAYPVGDSVKSYFGANSPYDMTAEEDMVRRAANLAYQKCLGYRQCTRR